MDELKPCPFCGHEPDTDGINAWCPLHSNIKLTIPGWNTRHPEHEEIRQLRSSFAKQFARSCRLASEKTDLTEEIRLLRESLEELRLFEMSAHIPNSIVISKIDEALQLNPEQTNEGDDEAL